MKKKTIKKKQMYNKENHQRQNCFVKKIKN